VKLYLRRINSVCGDLRVTDHQAHSAEEIKDKAARGVVWTVFGAGAQRGVLYLSTLVLAHLLHPADFGVIAIASTVISGSSVLRDLGLGDTLVQRPNLERIAQGTVLTLMILTGLLMAGVLAALAPVLAQFFHNPRLTDLIVALSPVLALGGLVGFYDSVLQRELRYRLRTYVSVCQSGLYVAISIILAVAGFGVWSLIVAQLVSIVISALLQLRLAAAFIVRPAFSRVAARETLRLGRAFLVGGLVDFTRQNTDYVSIGRFRSASQLSFYFSAFRICETLGGAIADAFTTISFSSFAQLRAHGTDPRSSYLSTIRLVGLITCPIGVLLSAVSAPFVTTAYGKQWLPMIPVLSVLGLWIAVRVLENVFAWLLISAGHTGFAVKFITASYFVQLPTIVAAASLGGIVTVAWVMLSYTLAVGLVFAWLISRKAGLSLHGQWRALRPVIIACVPAWFAARGISVAISSTVVALPVASLTGLGAYVGTLSVVEPGLLSWALRQARRLFKRGAGAPPTIASEGVPSPK
jgi:lipopolysaccharide exporter